MNDDDAMRALSSSVSVSVEPALALDGSKKPQSTRPRKVTQPASAPSAKKKAFAEELKETRRRIIEVLGAEKQKAVSAYTALLVHGVPKIARMTSTSRAAESSMSTSSAAQREPPARSHSINNPKSFAGESCSNTPRSQSQQSGTSVGRSSRPKRTHSGKFGAEFNAMKNRLTRDTITAPRSVQRVQKDNRLALHREYAKLSFATSYYIKKHPKHDPVKCKEVRRESFLSEVASTGAFLDQWMLAQQQQSNNAQGDQPLGGTRGGRAVQRYMAPMPRLSSPASDNGVAIKAPSAFTSTIDTEEILSRKYDGPVVSSVYRKKYGLTRLTSPNVDKSGSNASLSPTRMSPGGRHNVTNNSFSRNGSPVLGPSPSLSGSILPSLQPAQSMSIRAKSPPANHHNSRRSVTFNSSTNAHPTPSVAAQSEVARNAAPTPLCLTTPCALLDRMEASHMKEQEQESNPYIRFWLRAASQQSTTASASVRNDGDPPPGSDGATDHRDVRSASPTAGGKSVHHVTKATQSSYAKHSTPLTLTYFDDRGLIDGRQPKEEVVVSRAYTGVIGVTAESLQALRAQAMVDERRKIHERQERLAISLEEKSKSNKALSPDSGRGAQQPRPQESGSSMLMYNGPNNAAKQNHTIEPPTAERIQELLSTVFVRGGDVGAYIQKLKQSRSNQPTNEPTVSSGKHRLGGISKSRHLL